MPQKYNGHKNYNFWNVSLWISNDEGLYRFALDCIRCSRNSSDATRMFLKYAPKQTPDGVKYTLSNVWTALRNLSE